MSMDESSTHPSIGIDLGTTNSCVGVWQDEWVKIIPNEQGNTTTPSCVAFTDTRYYVGESAEQQATTNPCNTIFDVKRLIRKQFNSAKVQNDIKFLPLEVVAGPDDTPMISVQHRGKMQQHSASEISSMILHKLYKIAENFLDCHIKNAVISVPACFNDSQRLAIVKAGNNVGLNVMRIINEPTAAAIAYGFNNINDCDGEKNVLIFDLGGGTLDVSILIIEREKYEVKATVGDSHLGGVDFDNQLIRHCIEELKREHSGKDLNLNSRALGKLRYACKEAKIILSSTPEADIDIDSLLPGIHFQSCITRAKFEELNKDLFERCIDMVDKCLVDAKMYRSSIHDIVLIGGSTRIPKVQQMLREYFDGKELSMRINSDEAVACGAAIQAAILSNMSDNVPNFIVHDVTTHSLGIDIAKQVSMIPRNSAIPITKKMILTAGQIEFPIKVYEGEMTRIQDNHLLVEFPIQPDDPYGIIVGICVCFNINENGIFTISVEDKREINRIQITCDSMSTTSREQVEKMAKHTEKLKLEGDKYKQKPEAKNSPMTLGDHLGKTIKKEVWKLARVGNKKVKHAIVKTRQRREKNRRAIVREGFAGGQYRGDVNCLEKEPAQAGAVNLRRSSTTATRLMGNSTMMTKKQKNVYSMFTTSVCKMI